MQQKVGKHTSSSLCLPRRKEKLKNVPSNKRSKIAYIMSRFPKHTETFIINEMSAVEEQGVSVEVYPLIRQRNEIVHSEARKFVENAHFTPAISPSIVAANWKIAKRDLGLYFKTLFEVLRGTFGNANYFFGALGIFPKSLLFANKMVEEGVTHIHAHFSNHPGVAALIVHRLTGIPFSFTAHGHDIHVDRTMLKEKVDAAAFAVTVSQYNKKLMIDDCSIDAARKIHVIHCGVDIRKFQAVAREDSPSPIKIICVASLLEVKGHTYLIKACKLLRERKLNFKCDLIGEGDYREKIEREIGALGLGNYIELHGACTQSTVRGLLTASDICVLASVPTQRGAREGIPVSLMEAMAVGLPVVASDISGIPELVEDGGSGFLVPPRDVVALADKLEELILDHEVRKKMGQVGRDVILQEFNLGLNARNLIELIENGGLP